MSLDLGSAKTGQFQIGIAEIRIGKTTEAGKLTQDHSIGLLQNATVKYAQETTDLEAGLPKATVATVITKQTTSVSATAYEFTAKNLRVMLSDKSALDAAAVLLAPTVSTTPITVSALANKGATTLTVANAVITGVKVGDMFVVYPAGSPQDLSVLTLSSTPTAGEITSKTLTFTGTPTLFELPLGSIIYQVESVGLGSSAQTQYFSMDIVGKDQLTGKPYGFQLWKVAVVSGLEFSFSSDNFATLGLEFKVMKPTVDDLNGDLAYVRSINSANPYGRAILAPKA